MLLNRPVSTLAKYLGHALGDKLLTDRQSIDQLLALATLLSIPSRRKHCGFINIQC